MFTSKKPHMLWKVCQRWITITRVAVIDRIQYCTETKKKKDSRSCSWPGSVCDLNGTFLVIAFISWVFYLHFASCAFLLFEVTGCTGKVAGFTGEVVTCLSVYDSTLRLASCYYVLVSLRGIFAHTPPWVLSVLVNCCLCGSGASGLSLCCYHQSLCALIHSICWWYMPCRGLVFHYSSSSSSPSIFICLRHYWNGSSQGPIFLRYLRMLHVSSCIVALTLTPPPPPSFCCS